MDDGTFGAQISLRPAGEDALKRGGGTPLGDPTAKARVKPAELNARSSPAPGSHLPIIGQALLRRPRAGMRVLSLNEDSMNPEKSLPC